MKTKLYNLFRPAGAERTAFIGRKLYKTELKTLDNEDKT